MKLLTEIKENKREDPNTIEARPNPKEEKTHQHREARRRRGKWINLTIGMKEWNPDLRDRTWSTGTNKIVGRKGETKGQR